MSRARIRTIKPELLEDERLGSCSRDARLLFVALITLADDEGRTRAAGAFIRGQRYAYDEGLTVAELERWLAELVDAGLVVVYEVERQRYAAIVGWATHQRIDKPSASQLPAPEEGTEVELGEPSSPREPSTAPREVSSSPREPSRKVAGDLDLDPDLDPDLDLDRSLSGSVELGAGVASPPAPPPELPGIARQIRDRTAQVLEVFESYRKHHPRSFPKPSRASPEWRAIERRLGEGFTVDDLTEAIEGCHKTPHNLGENDRGTKYLGLELIMRSGSQVTRFAETARAGGAPRSSRRRTAAEAQLDESAEVIARMREAAAVVGGGLERAAVEVPR